MNSTIQAASRVIIDTDVGVFSPMNFLACFCHGFY